MNKMNETTVKIILDKAEEVFLSTGFRKVNIKGIDYFQYNGIYCKISYVEQFDSIIIETADNKAELINNVFEDSDIYELYENIDIDVLIKKIKNDLIKYYIY